MTPAHITRVGELDAKMRASYDTLRVDGSVTYEEAYIKRLIFRSKQRGWLEVDLLMGAYATKFLAGKTKEELTVYERILNRETLDLYVSGGRGVGEFSVVLLSCSVFRAVVETAGAVARHPSWPLTQAAFHLTPCLFPPPPLFYPLSFR
jgi:succinate dehydrogenase flavin-adding protein (antitoxin of CptAB toxin-antitoxin module)